jgi:hypothetical protein
MTLREIIRKNKSDVDNFLDGNDLSDTLYDDLYEYYCNNNEMPYGTAKARDGDPREWITQRFESDAWI